MMEEWKKVKKYWKRLSVGAGMISLGFIWLLMLPLFNNQLDYSVPLAYKGAAFPAKTVVTGCAPCAALTAHVNGEGTSLMVAARDEDSRPIEGMEISLELFDQEIVMITDEKGVAYGFYSGIFGTSPYFPEELTIKINGKPAIVQDDKHGFTLVFELPAT
jgi:hypothetical protein